MEQLPDNVLVMVMQYLDITDILRFRNLCKRFRDLALLPEVWKHRSLPSSAPWACAVLRLAPCLYLIEANLRSASSCHAAYISTRCAVKVLHLSVADETGSVHSAALVCKQEALGRLQHVSVYFFTVTNASVLLATLASTTGLKSLKVGSQLPLSAATSTTTVVHSTVSAASLRRFDSALCATVGLESFVNTMLAGHAATLEVVLLGAITTSTASLLTNIPNLRELAFRCCVPGLEAVAAIQSLRVLNLGIRTKPRYAAAAVGAAKLLERAKHLREVTLEYWPPISSNTDVGVDLVLALATSKSLVEKLSIDNDSDAFPQIYPLICALPRMPALRHLNLEIGGVPTSYLLLAITPATAPALDLVELSLADNQCAHAWLHGKSVSTVLTAQPMLHIKLKFHIMYCGDISCEGCVRTCHRGLSNDVQWGDKFLGLFSHGSTDICSQDHSDPNCCRWIHIP